MIGAIKMNWMFSEIGSIFVLHRIAPYEKGKLTYNEDMKVAPEELKKFIKQLRSKKIIFVSLDELNEIIDKKKKSTFKFATITLDDGYRDNIEYGYPIFKQENVPFCIYITNSFPNRTTNLWWYALEELVLENKSLRGSGNVTIDNSTAESKHRNFLMLRREILDHYFLDPTGYLQNLGKFEFNLAEEVREKCLTWGEIISISIDPLVTIGAHTMNHYPLTRLSVAMAEWEIRNSKSELEKKINKPVQHFAFPFGGKLEANDREYALVRSGGFKTAVTTLNGFVYKNDNASQLPRIFLRPLRNNSLTLEIIMRKGVKDYLKYLIRVLKK